MTTVSYPSRFEQLGQTVDILLVMPLRKRPVVRPRLFTKGARNENVRDVGIRKWLPPRTAIGHVFFT